MALLAGRVDPVMAARLPVRAAKAGPVDQVQEIFLLEMVVPVVRADPVEMDSLADPEVKVARVAPVDQARLEARVARVDPEVPVAPEDQVALADRAVLGDPAPLVVLADPVDRVVLALVALALQVDPVQVDLEAVVQEDPEVRADQAVLVVGAEASLVMMVITRAIQLPLSNFAIPSSPLQAVASPSQVVP